MVLPEIFSTPIIVRLTLASAFSAVITTSSRILAVFSSKKSNSVFLLSVNRSILILYPNILITI